MAALGSLTYLFSRTVEDRPRTLSDGPPANQVTTNARTSPRALPSHSVAASRRHLDASLDLFARKSPRSWRDLAEKRALSARPALFFVDGGSIN